MVDAAGTANDDSREDCRRVKPQRIQLAGNDRFKQSADHDLFSPVPSRWFDRVELAEIETPQAERISTASFPFIPTSAFISVHQRFPSHPRKIVQ